MHTANVDRVRPLAPKSIALVFGLTAAGLACGLAVLAPGRPEMVLGLAGFPLLFASGLALPSLRCLPLGPRIVLLLFVLRPLLDMGNPNDASVTSQASVFSASVKTIYAALVLLVLFIIWAKADDRSWLVEGPNKWLVALACITIVAWAAGGLTAGASLFVRTIWGLLVALLLGPLFRTQEQIETFIRTIFYSSILVLLILAFNLKQGDYLYYVWRLGGQYDVPNTLAAVAFCFFAYGLYAVGQASSVRGKAFDLLLLGLLATTIVFTQSRTVGALMILAAFLWLWTQKNQRALYASVGLLLILAVGSNVTFGWRLISDLSPQQAPTTGQATDEVVNLAGRAYLWAETLEQYASASPLRKLTGLGWGTVSQNFKLSDLAEVSSVTENSFLWFLVGAGALGLIAFCVYLIWLTRSTWASWRRAQSEFERRLSLLAFLACLAFLIEGSTFDLVLSPVASGYFYAILSIFWSYRTRNT